MNKEYIFVKLAQMVPQALNQVTRVAKKAKILKELEAAYKSKDSKVLNGLMKKYETSGDKTEQAAHRLFTGYIAKRSGVSTVSGSAGNQAAKNNLLSNLDLKKTKGVDSKNVGEFISGLSANVKEKSGGKLQRFVTGAQNQTLKAGKPGELGEVAAAKKRLRGANKNDATKIDAKLKSMEIKDPAQNKAVLDQARMALQDLHGKGQGNTMMGKLKKNEFASQVPKAPAPKANATKVDDKRDEVEDTMSLSDDLKGMWSNYKKRWKEKPGSTAAYTAGGVGAAGGLGYLAFGKSSKEEV